MFPSFLNPLALVRRTSFDTLGSLSTWGKETMEWCNKRRINKIVVETQNQDTAWQTRDKVDSMSSTLICQSDWSIASFLASIAFWICSSLFSPWFSLLTSSCNTSNETAPTRQKRNLLFGFYPEAKENSQLKKGFILPEAAMTWDLMRWPLSRTHSAKKGTFMRRLSFPSSFAAFLV